MAFGTINADCAYCYAVETPAIHIGLTFMFFKPIYTPLSPARAPLSFPPPDPLPGEISRTERHRSPACLLIFFTATSRWVFPISTPPKNVPRARNLLGRGFLYITWKYRTYLNRCAIPCEPLNRHLPTATGFRARARRVVACYLGDAKARYIPPPTIRVKTTFATLHHPRPYG